MKKGHEFLWGVLILIVVVAVLHLIRAVMGWSLTVESFEIPVWLSYVAFLVLGFLSYKLYIHLKK